jgi:hypothetical protein
VRIDARRAFYGLLIAGLAGAVLIVPAITLIGSLLAPSQPEPVRRRAPPLIGDALWARVHGGRATELQSINPFSVGRTMFCAARAELLEPGPERDRRQDECMLLMPGFNALGHVSSLHMRADGVWQDARVPFVQIAMMSRMASRWTRQELIDTLAARGEFAYGWNGVDAAAPGFFGVAPGALTLPQAALLAAMLGDTAADPWCQPVAASTARRRVLERMRANLVVDEAAAAAANLSDLGLTTPPASHQPCK